MRKSIALLFLLLCAVCYSYAQDKASYSGVVKDTLENKGLKNAVIALSRTSDSLLVAFTRTDAQGRFSLTEITPGEYELLISYPEFADYLEEVSLAPGENKAGVSIPLTLKSKILNEVIVRSKSIIIKGDTTEFNARSFKVREGATVEELLKVMPGFTIDSKGEITAQGKRVDKVLVDGEEFFGDDPTIATQNIGAKAVDKVQVYDTKTEQENMTGITSGAAGKTINIKLKEDAKKGSFGKAELGSDFDRLLDGKLMYNKLKGAKKISVYGTKSNTSTGTLGWDEQRKLGIEDDFEYDELSDVYYSFGGSDEFNNWQLRGLPDAYAAGALYIDKWHGDTNSINGYYRYNRLGTTNETFRSNQTLLEDTTYYTNQQTKTNALLQQHNATVKYEWKIDSLASIKLVTSGKILDKNSNETSYSESLDENRAYVNQVDQYTGTNSEKKEWQNQLIYKQQFNKKGRLLITNLRYGLVRDDIETRLRANKQFYENGFVDSTVVTDQMKITDGKSETYGAKLTYNEPLSDRLNLVAEYAYNRNNSESYRNTFEKDGNDKYTMLNNLFSNNFNLDASSNSGSAYLRYMSDKFRFSMGSGISNTVLDLFNVDTKEKNDYHFFNVTPKAQFSYRKSQQSNLSLNYEGSTIQPNISQLQPVRDNTNQLNEYIGNPDLKVGFNHNISLFYYNYKVLSGSNTWANVGITTRQKAISTQSTVIDGIQYTMPVNVDGNYNWYAYYDHSFGRKEKKLNFGFGGNANGGRSVNFVNGQRNENNFTMFGGNINLSMFQQNKYEFSFRPNATRNLSKSSLRKDVNNNYWNYGGNFDGRVYLPLGFEIWSELDVNLQQKIDAFDNSTNITVWNADLVKKVFKNKNGRIVFRARDILNQNKGFSRTINSNFVSEERYQRVGQYFMLALEWTFNKMPGGAKSN